MIMGRVDDLHASGGVAQVVGAGDIGANEVALHLVLARVAAVELNAVPAVARDDVAGPDRRPPDKLSGQGVADEYAIEVIAQTVSAGDIGANEFALHLVAVHANAIDLNAVPAVARDDVAGTGRRPPNKVKGPADEHPIEVIAQTVSAGDIGANEVALHSVTQAANLNAVAVVARDDVALCQCCPPDRVVLRRENRRKENQNAISRVAQIDAAGDIGADEIACCPVLTPGDLNTVPAVARDDVAGPGRRPPDRVATR